MFSWSLSWSRACFLLFLFFLIAFLFESVFPNFFLFFLYRFLGWKCVFLFTYLLDFFYKFPPQQLLWLKIGAVNSSTAYTYSIVTNSLTALIRGDNIFSIFVNQLIQQPMHIVWLPIQCLCSSKRIICVSIFIYKVF